MIVYLIEVDGYNPATLQVETLRFCTGKGFTTAPSDTPPSTVYFPRVKQAGSLKCEMFAQGATSGKSAIGYGEVTLANSDGALDYLAAWGFDGRNLICWMWDNSKPWATRVPLYKVTVQQPVPERELFTLKIRDLQFTLDRPLQDLKFQGSNVLPTGLEGTANDIMGKPKPLTIGKVFNAAPVCVNTSLLIYALNIRHSNQFDAEPDVDSLSNFDAATINVDVASGISIGAVYDKGAALTRGVDYTDSTDMQLNAPAAGYFRVVPGEGYFRLGSTPAGTVTADCMDGTSVTVTPTAANLAYQVLTQLLSVTDDNIKLSDITALNAANSAPAGIYIDSETTGTPTLDALCGSIGAWYGFDRLGLFRMKQVRLPLTAPIMTLNARQINTFEMLSIADSPNGVPVKRININWRKNYTVQAASEVAGSVDPDKRNQIGLEYRQAFKEDIEVLRPHLLAGEMTVDSALYDDPTETECPRLLDIYSVRRDRLQVTLKMRLGLENLLNLGENITAVLPRYGYDAGKIRKIISFDLDCENSNLTLILWG